MSYALMFLALFAVGVYNIRWGEVVPVARGFGWDGEIYGDLAMNFDLSGLSPYYLQRIFPSAVIHYGLLTLAFRLNRVNVIRGFKIYNLVLILLACFLWIQIANRLGISLRGKWLGFFGLFVNYAILKQAFYYPVLTDVTAFAIGFLLLYFFLKDNPLGIFAATLVAAFTWPIAVLTGLLLLLFPSRPLKDTGEPNTRLSLLSAAGVTIAYLGLVFYFYFVKGQRTAGFEAESVIESLAYPSLILAAGYVFLATKKLVEGVTIRFWWDGLKTTTPLRIGLSLLLILVQVAFLVLTRSNQDNTSEEQLAIIALLSIAKPLLFLVSHMVYYGPIMMLFIFLWEPFSRVAKQHGVGMVTFTVLTVFLSLDPESRHAISAFPLLVPLLVKSTERFHWKSSIYWVIGILAFAFSKFWFRINPGSSLEPPLVVNFQSYFMNQGPWMSLNSYLLQGAAALGSMVILYALLMRASGSPTRAT